MTAMELSTSDNPFKLFQLLQLCDSAYPIGAYAHSNGCEANHQLCLLSEEGGFKIFLKKCVENEVNQKLPFVREAFNNAFNIDEIVALDQLLEASLSNHVANRSSTKLGKAALEASRLSFKFEIASQMLQAIDCLKMAGHFGITFGVIGAHIKLTIKDTLIAYLFGYIRDTVSAAVRLDLLSCMSALEIQRDIWEFALTCIDESLQIPLHETSVIHPITDLATCAHSQLYCRLFQS